jgi:hypothetical protein
MPPRAALEEAVEVLARIPHVDDGEAVVRGAGGVEGLAVAGHGHVDPGGQGG